MECGGTKYGAGRQKRMTVHAAYGGEKRVTMEESDEVRFESIGRSKKLGKETYTWYQELHRFR